MADEGKIEAAEKQVETPELEESEAQRGQDEAEDHEMTTLHERTIAAMSYFGFLAIVPFYLKKDSKFCRFHGKQGLLLAIMFFIAKLLTVIDFIDDLALILQVTLMFVMSFAALSGRWKRLPFLYDWACQLEEALSLKTKEEELEEVALKPDEVKSATETPKTTK